MAQVDLIDAPALLQDLLTDPTIAARLGPLPDDLAQLAVERLKQEADRYWSINAHRSVDYAQAIIAIGEARRDQGEIALGIMARGDALKLIGQTAEAWQELGAAGELFLLAHDEVGWARTRIGRLLICVDLHRVAEAVADAERARTVFAVHGEQEKLLRLDLNLAIVYDLRGEHAQALALYQTALAAANALGVAGQAYLGALYTNIGYAYDHLGNLHAALLHHEQAHAFFAARDEPYAVATTQLNIAHIAMAQGHYRRALRLLHQTRALRLDARIALGAARVDCDIVECYLFLNRYREARDVAREAIELYRSSHLSHLEGIVLLHLAVAEAERGDTAAAEGALAAAEPIFASLGATSWTMVARLRHGRIALQRGDSAAALHHAGAALDYYEAAGQQLQSAAARLLVGQALFAMGDLDGAGDAAMAALATARRCNVPPLRYATHLLLGQVAELRGDQDAAIRRFHAAAATVDRVQRGLTITLRPGFLEDKGAALRSLLGLFLRRGDSEQAWQALERAKGQALLGYLAHREQFHWAGDDVASRALVDELNLLRAEHQVFYHAAYPEQTGAAAVAAAPDAVTAVQDRERRIRAIAEQLYLRAGQGETRHATLAPSLAAVRQALGDRTLLIEFYHDGQDFWAFTLDQAALTVRQLSLPLPALAALLDQLEANIAAALASGEDSRAARQLERLAQRIGQRLYEALLAPFADLLAGRRLLIVPYGPLHALPFHLLHTGVVYLIQQHEIVMLPAAALLLRKAVPRPPGAVVLVNSRQGRLPQTLPEGRFVHDLFGGDVWEEAAATRAALETPPRQILHIAAHGEHRLDSPDLSYVELADGHVYTDDLLQHDMSYELVTLSACETGRAHVAISDELIGLGRGFLYAGAGALLVSLWRVSDAHVVVFMQQFYRALVGGASKSLALCRVQRAMVDVKPRLHPAFWGAFQLIGDPGPLSATGHTHLEGV